MRHALLGLLFLGLLAFALVGWTPLPLDAATPTQAPAPYAEDLQFVVSGGELRWYRVFAPDSVPQGTSLPVVFCFHGGGGNASQAAGAYGVVQEAEQRGWIAVFPEGSGRFGGPPNFLLETWNAGNCCAYAMTNDVDDVGFFADMLAKLDATHPIDPDRVFLTGMSNGGMMSYRIAVERPDLVRAIAPVAGSLGVSDPSVQVPILAIHGLLDANVPFGGGQGSGTTMTDFASQLESILPFLAVNGGPVPGAPFVQGQAQVFYSFGSSGGSDTLYFLALDGGHTWPGGQGSVIDPDDPVHIDLPATPLMFDFFALQ